MLNDMCRFCKKNTVLYGGSEKICQKCEKSVPWPPSAENHGKHPSVCGECHSVWYDPECTDDEGECDDEDIYDTAQDARSCGT